MEPNVKLLGSDISHLPLLSVCAILEQHVGPHIGVQARRQP